MTKREATYFMEGLAAGIAAPNHGLAKKLFGLIARLYQITVDDFEPVRKEIDVYLDEIDAEELASCKGSSNASERQSPAGGKGRELSDGVPRSSNRRQVHRHS